MEVEEIFYLLEKQKDIIKIKRLEKLENWLIQIQMKSDKPQKLFNVLKKEFDRLKDNKHIPKTKQEQVREVEKLRNFLK
jgi:hypothetical protein